MLVTAVFAGSVNATSSHDGRWGRSRSRLRVLIPVPGSFRSSRYEPAKELVLVSAARCGPQRVSERGCSRKRLVRFRTSPPFQRISYTSACRTTASASCRTSLFDRISSSRSRVPPSTQSRRRWVPTSGRGQRRCSSVSMTLANSRELWRRSGSRCHLRNFVGLSNELGARPGRDASTRSNCDPGGACLISTTAPRLVTCERRAARERVRLRRR
jgi:hypothetical protein